MKKTIKPITILLLSILLIAFNTNVSAQNKKLNNKNSSTILIAKVKDGVTSFVVNQNTLIKDWQRFISEQYNSKICRLNQPQIISKNYDTELYLSVTGYVDTIAIRFTIALKQVSISCLVLMGQTIQCASTIGSDNKEGCIPKGTMCVPCSNCGDCKKTITNSPFAIFPSLTPSICE